MANLIVSFIVNAIALYVVTLLASGLIRIEGIWVILGGALSFTLVNAIVRPILTIVTLPITIFTLGLFMLVISALVFWLASIFVPGFFIAGFWGALVGGILMGVLNAILRVVIH